MRSLTTRGALLQALRRGPAFGAEIIRRLAQLSGGAIDLSPARVYPVLQELQEEELVIASSVVPKGKRGARKRIYYDLTPLGVEESTRERDALLALLLPSASPPASPGDRTRMAERIAQMDELSSFGEELRTAPLAKRRAS